MFSVGFLLGRWIFASQLLRILQTRHANHEACSSYDAAELDSTMKDNQIGILSGHGTKVDPLSAEVKDKDGYWNNQEFKYSVVVDDFTNDNEKRDKDAVAASTLHTESSQTDSDLYTGNNFMECDLPELIVCYKDSTCHAVKDICVDEGVPTEHKLSTESIVDDRYSLTSNEYKHTDMTKEIVNMDFLFQDGFRSSCKDCNKDPVNDCASKVEVNIDLLIPYEQNSSSEDDIHHDGAYDCGAVGLKSSLESEKVQDSASFCGFGNLIQSGEEKCNAAEKTTESVSNSMLLVKEFHKETSLKFLLESSKCVDNDVQQSNQRSCVQAISQGPEVSKTEESNKTSDVDNLIYNSEVESGIITFNFDSSKHAESTRDETPENVIEQQPKSENKPIHDDGVFNNHLFVTSQFKRGDGGESSFSVGGPLSDAVTNSGPLPFSGSISLRSDSSTTSTRSFAFPVLPNEWNSSPIRMARADRRHLRNRKHRGWRLGLLCCRF